MYNNIVMPRERNEELVYGNYGIINCRRSLSIRRHAQHAHYVTGVDLLPIDFQSSWNMRNPRNAVRPVRPRTTDQMCRRDWCNDSCRLAFQRYRVWHRLQKHPWPCVHSVGTMMYGMHIVDLGKSCIHDSQFYMLTTCVIIVFVCQ